MSQQIDLTGRHALITGASSGLGAHLARTLAKAGAAVTLTARRLEPMAEMAKDMASQGLKAQAIGLDVTDKAAIAPAFAKASVAFGIPDILLNNAGIAVTAPALEQSEADWDRVMDTNLKAVFFMAQAFARSLKDATDTGERVGGAIINTASITGLQAATHIPAYAVAKAGVVHLTKCLAAEWARYNIRVNAIAPGYIETDINRDFLQSAQGEKLINKIPQRRVGAPSDLDGLVLLLASHTAGGFMTGGVYTVDGGHTAQPL
jgi:Dehydrogenases with different specificities (related to short-chain alcohol dehydrogenases)